jgi:predicted 2-oxoglutarate/Fe(II)-dependent dioxygenase YbiX
VLRQIVESPAIASCVGVASTDCSYIIASFKDAPVHREAGHEALSSVVKIGTSEVNILFHNTVLNQRTEIRSIFGISPLHLEPVKYVDYAVGAEVRPHTDTIQSDNPRLITAIMYLNDNYDDGRLYFPSIGFYRKPEAGELLLFPSMLIHAVEKVATNRKHILVSFLHMRPYIPGKGDGG